MLARTRASLDKKQGDAGFTLIELLVVVIIIGILAAIATPIFLSQKKKAVDASLKSDIRTLADQEETYSVDHQTDAIPYTAEKTKLDGIKFSPSNRVFVSVNNVGYCIQGWNTKASADTQTSKAWWYDSKLGGLQSTMGAAPAGGSCTDTGGAATEVSTP